MNEKKIEENGVEEDEIGKRCDRPVYDIKRCDRI